MPSSPQCHHRVLPGHTGGTRHGGVLGKECVRGSRGPVSNSGDHRRQLRGQVERRERGASSTRAARRGGRHIPQGPNPIASAGWPTYRKRLAQWSPHSGDGKKKPRVKAVRSQPGAGAMSRWASKGGLSGPGRLRQPSHSSKSSWLRDARTQNIGAVAEAGVVGEISGTPGLRPGAKGGSGQ